MNELQNKRLQHNPIFKPYSYDKNKDNPITHKNALSILQAIPNFDNVKLKNTICVMRKILFLITLLVIIILGLSSCSKDEAVIDVNQLEGVWGLVSENGYYYDEGEKISYNDNYNPFEPTSDCEKIMIQKIGDNRYKMTTYEYYSGNWHQTDIANFSLDGNNIIPEDMQGVDVSVARIVEASSDQFVVETSGQDEDGDFYDKYTYQRMTE